SSIAASGDFAQTNNCGASLNPGATCSINVTFTPTAKDNRSGTITITDDATTSPQGIPVSGLGTDALLSTGSLNFSLQLLGTTSVSKKITLTNMSSSVGVTISTIVLGGADPAAFHETDNCTTSPLAMSGGTCTINVAFTPTAVRSFSATLTINNDGGGPQTIT